LSPTAEPFVAGEHELELHKAGLFAGGPIEAQLLAVSEELIRFRCSKELELGQALRFRIFSRVHKDELSGAGRVGKLEPADGAWKVDLVVEKKARDHDTTIRAMRGWYSSDRYRARESTRMMKAPPRMPPPPAKS
jgi:hypothetical protein